MAKWIVKPHEKLVQRLCSCRSLEPRSTRDDMEDFYSTRMRWRQLPHWSLDGFHIKELLPNKTKQLLLN